MKIIDPAALPPQSSPRLQSADPSRNDDAPGRTDPVARRAGGRLATADETDDQPDNASILESATNPTKSAAAKFQQEDAQTDIREPANNDAAAGDAEADIEAQPGSIPSNASSGLKRRRVLLSKPDFGKSDPPFEKGSYRNWRGTRDRNATPVESDRDTVERALLPGTSAEDPPLPAPGKRRRDLTRAELLNGLDYSKVFTVTENPSKRRGRSGIADAFASGASDDSTDFFGTADGGVLPGIFSDGQEAGRPGQSGNGHKNRRNRTRDQHGNGVPIDESDAAFEQEVELGSLTDRVHYLAMVAAAAHDTLRPPKLEANRVMLPVGPNSRAECEERCGSDGFCDPSSMLGCGGEHCGRPYLDL